MKKKTKQTNTAVKIEKRNKNRKNKKNKTAKYNASKMNVCTAACAAFDLSTHSQMDLIN